MNALMLRYSELTKPKVTLLNLLVGATCLILAAFPVFDWVRLTVFLVAGYLACGGCAALNCVYDRDTDAQMERTSRRAIPSGAVTPRKAMFFGSTLTAVGVCLGFLFFNVLTGLMMVLGATFYLLVYTIMLKRKSPWNVVIGGAAGSFAALSGWTAVANTLSLAPLLVSAVDFLWTPGHLWGLAIRKVAEYRNAGIPMLPVVAGVKKAAQIVFLFNLAAVGLSLLLPFLGLTGVVYLAVAVCAGVWFTAESRRLLTSPAGKDGFRLFLFSMPYLACLMIGLIVDKFFFTAKLV